jgi:hypothetical protein
VPTVGSNGSPPSAAKSSEPSGHDFDLHSAAPSAHVVQRFGNCPGAGSPPAPPPRLIALPAESHRLPDLATFRKSAAVTRRGVISIGSARIKGQVVLETPRRTPPRRTLRDHTRRPVAGQQRPRPPRRTQHLRLHTSVTVRVENQARTGGAGPCTIPRVVGVLPMTAPVEPGARPRPATRNTGCPADTISAPPLPVEDAVEQPGTCRCRRRCCRSCD